MNPLAFLAQITMALLPMVAKGIVAPDPEIRKDRYNDAEAREVAREVEKWFLLRGKMQNAKRLNARRRVSLFAQLQGQGELLERFGEDVQALEATFQKRMINGSVQ